MIDALGRGGAERLLTAYAQEIQRQGHDVIVVVLKDRDGNPEAKRLSAAGIPVQMLRIDKLRRVDQIKHALQRLRELKPDIIHAHLEVSSIVAGLASAIIGVPVVSTLHTLDHPQRIDRASARLWVMNRILSDLYDRVICLSKAIEESARTHGLARAPLITLSNGIEIEVFDRVGTPRQEIRKNFNIPSNAPLVVTIAVLRAPKGIDRLIRAMTIVRSRVPDSRLLIVGDGEERERLVALTAERGMVETVTFAGFREDVPDLLRAADVFVLPTLWDALPTVVIEAMAARIPVVASRVGGIPDMVSDGIQGRLIPPDDPSALGEAIAEILKDDLMRGAMAMAARHRTESDFSIVGQVGKLTALYRELVEARRSQR